MLTKIFQQNHIIPKFRQFSTSVSLSSAAARKKVCIVGAGPAGFYAAQQILKNISDCDVDIVEKLPVPYGLVRFGVAPDHPEVKNVINTFVKIAENPRFRFLGNLSLGKDVHLQDLRERYHAVLLTYGAEKDRNLNIPNEDLPNVLSARKFVAWYNGLPGAENLEPDLSGETVTLVGQGNVAIDIARIILSPLDRLKNTDITEFALETLSRSKVQKVQLVGRRGPLQAAFTIKELREMLKLPNVDTIWRKDDFLGVEEVIPSLARPRKRLTDLMLTSLKSQTITNSKKQFLPIFLRSPKLVQKNSIEFTITELNGNSAVPTKATESVQSDLILRSIGYKSVCADSGICFDESNGRILNKMGRVWNTSTDNVDKGLYVAGWLGTGPTGVILTTMSGAFGVAKAICDDINSGAIDCTNSKHGLDTNGRRIVSWQDWQKIDKAEIEAGRVAGKPREKIVCIKKMLDIAGV